MGFRTNAHQKLVHRTRMRRAVESLRIAPRLPVSPSGVTEVQFPIRARTDPVVQCAEAVMQYHRVRRSRRY